MHISHHRGVWIAPFRGPLNEFFLFAMDSLNRLVAGPVMVPKGGDHIGMADDLWDVLDSSEPQLRGIMGTQPTWRILPRTRHLRKFKLKTS